MSETEQKTSPLLTGPIDSSLRRFAVPLAASFLINMLYSWVDTWYVSRLGPEAVAAIGISEQLLFFIFTIGSGFAIGTGVIVARRIGEDNFKQAELVAGQSIVGMFVFSLGLTLFLYWGIAPILTVMGVAGKVRGLADIYLSNVVIGIVGNFLMFQMNSIVRSAGNSLFPMTMLITSAILNAIIAPFLIFGIWIFPELGMAGAGLSTAIAQLTTAMITFLILANKGVSIRPIFIVRDMKPELFLNIVKVGFPATIQLLSVSVNRLILFALANSFGTAVVATYTLGLKIDLFVFMSIFATGTAIEVATGQNLGAGKIDRVYKYYYSGIKQMAVLMAIFGILVFFFGEYFAEIFTRDQEIISKTEKYIRITAFSYIPFAIGIISTRAMNGAGDTKRSLIIVFGILFLVQLPIAFLLTKSGLAGEEGIWYAILISQICFSGIGLLQIRLGKWLNVKL